MILAGNSRTKAKLEAAGATVIEYSGAEISYKGTGGPTCLTCPILRV
ncbi:NG,NG-dimethylarginine dimethylaminohydrolase 1 [Geomicrobium sp. JCM 19037]|nr:NG,NG-dimethylarginine dimethylaminohydrolase 1 [Geomicrobium sp. JCM 19037]